MRIRTLVLAITTALLLAVGASAAANAAGQTPKLDPGPGTCCRA